MAQEFLIITDENGNILDKNIQRNVNTAMGPEFDFHDVFVYSHGWWTSAARATAAYNRFSIELARTLLSLGAPFDPSGFGMGIHWPSMLSQNATSILNMAEAMSYFGMGTRANAVGSNAGFALVRLVTAASPQAPLHMHLLGHSFGCRVVCMALQRLVEKGIAETLNNISIDLVLLQAAFNNDELEDKPIADYRNVLGGLPGKLRTLVTISQLDKALHVAYPAAERLANLFHRGAPALGAAGPSPGMVAQFPGSDPNPIPIVPGFNFAGAPLLGDQNLVVADLTPVHQADDADFRKNSGLGPFEYEFAGHHSDIFLQEIYNLLAAFLFKTKANVV
jgi:hypothetical protein